MMRKRKKTITMTRRRKMMMMTKRRNMMMMTKMMRKWREDNEGCCFFWKQLKNNEPVWQSVTLPKKKY